MTPFVLSTEAKEDLIRIYNYGIQQFGERQADRYLEGLFMQFEVIAKRPHSFEAVYFFKKEYKRCVYGSDCIFFHVNEGLIYIDAIIGRQRISSILKP